MASPEQEVARASNGTGVGREVAFGQIEQVAGSRDMSDGLARTIAGPDGHAGTDGRLMSIQGCSTRKTPLSCAAVARRVPERVRIRRQDWGQSVPMGADLIASGGGALGGALGWGGGGVDLD